jgi:hypothetical protein
MSYAIEMVADIEGRERQAAMKAMAETNKAVSAASAAYHVTFPARNLAK